MSLHELLNQLKDPGLLTSLSLLVIVLGVSYFQKLKIEKEILWATLRGSIQLILIGFVLLWIFKFDRWWIILLTFFTMIIFAGSISQKRGREIPGVFLIIVISLTVSSSVTLGSMILTGTLKPEAQELIPVGGMIIGNSMGGASLVLNRLQAEMKLRREEILVYLSLGASQHQAVHAVLQSTLKASLIFAIDAMKALGIIVMPGVMAGLILAGESPLLAVRYQLIVIFMIVTSAAITNLIVLQLAYRQFFKNHRLLLT